MSTLEWMGIVGVLIVGLLAGWFAREFTYSCQSTLPTARLAPELEVATPNTAAPPAPIRSPSAFTAGPLPQYSELASILLGVPLESEVVASAYDACVAVGGGWSGVPACDALVR